MQIALNPTLTDELKAQTRNWLSNVLNQSELAYRSACPLSNRVNIYVDGVPCLVSQNSCWMRSGNALYIGTSNTSAGHQMPKAERLAVLGAIITLVDAWDELLDVFGRAMSRTLLESYNTLMGGLIQHRGGEAPVGLAINGTRSQVAAKFGEDYFLPNGEQVQIDESWVVLN